MEIYFYFGYFEFVFSLVLYIFSMGRGVKGAANGIAWVIESAHEGTGFAFKSFTSNKMMDMAVSALFPILLVVPLFDILMYFNILPKIIGGIGWVLAKVTRQPKFESFLVLK